MLLRLDENVTLPLRVCELDCDCDAVPVPVRVWVSDWEAVFDAVTDEVMICDADDVSLLL